MPPIVLFQKKGEKKYLIGDGLHRSLANKENNCRAIQAEIKEGGYEEALKYALTANSTHGLRRSNADKRRCVMVAVKQWPKMSNAQLAEIAGVSGRYVGEIRGEMETSKMVPKITERTTKSGRTIDTAPIGSTLTRSESNPPKVKKLTDDTGWEIPESLHALWHRDVELGELSQQISSIKCIIEKAQENKDPLFNQVNHTSIIADLKSAWKAIDVGRPSVVCTSCQGHPETQPKGQCRLCVGMGLISKYRYDKLVPEEIKQVRSKGVKK